MKSYIIFILLLSFAASSLNAQQSDYDAFKVQVDGLGCPFCAYGLEKKFKELKGLKKLKIEIESGIMSFNYPAEKALALEVVNRQVKKAGYTPIWIEINRADGSFEKTAAKSKEKLGKLTEESIMVAGNCKMCQARIENTAKELSGVADATWDAKTQMLKLRIDREKVKLEAIAKALADAGHDTKTSLAPQAVYDELPACCHYKRLKP